MENLRNDFGTYLAHKLEARSFLEELEGFLEEKTCSRSEIRKTIEEAVLRAKASTLERHLAYLEGAFLNLYAVPLIHKYLTTVVGLDDQKACMALTSESYKHHPKIASNSPASKEKHPFTKSVGEGLESIVARWWDSHQSSAVSQSCPDLALGFPCPHKIVFEGKYFTKGSLKAAKKELARDIYQCFFYLGLPRVPTDGHHAPWEYDYACLLAYDSSEEGNLKSVWHDIKEEVKTGMWNGANIYVMVL
jgi:hypothetical protein